MIFKLAAIALFWAASSLAVSQDIDQLENWLMLSYSTEPDDRIAAARGLAGIADRSAGKRFLELSRDPDVRVKAEVLLIAMNHEAWASVDKYNNHAYGNFRAIIDGLAGLPEEERERATAAALAEYGSTRDVSLNDVSKHYSWLALFAKDLEGGPLLDRIATLFIKEIDLDWALLDYGPPVDAIGPPLYDSTPQFFELYEREPGLCLRLIRHSEDLQLRFYSTLAYRGDQKAVEHVLRLTYSKDEHHRKTAVYVLAEVGPAHIKSQADRLLRDKSRFVRGAAASALLAVDAELELERVLRLSLEDDKIAFAVISTIRSMQRNRLWPVSDTRIRTLPGLTDDQILHLCRAIAIKGGDHPVTSAIDVMSNCSKDRAIKELVSLVPLVEKQLDRDFIGARLRRLGYVPPSQLNRA